MPHTRSVSVFGLAILCASVAACSSLPDLSSVADIGAYKTGVAISQEQMARIVDNKSVKADVVALVGHPNRKAQVGDKEVWYYDYTKISHFASNVSEATVFEFDAKGVVVSHYKTAGSSSNPLLKAAGL